MSLRLTRSDAFGIALGLYATLSQIVLMRESLGLSGGNELTMGLGFAAWLLGVGGGAIIAGVLKRPHCALVIGTLLAPVVSSGCLFLFRLHRLILDLPSGVDPSLLGLSALLTTGLGAGGVMVGLLFTTAARSARGQERAPVSRLYTSEAVGALIGGLLFTFVLAGRASHLTTIGLSGIFIFGGMTVSSRHPITRRFVFVFTFLNISVVASGVLTKVDHLADIHAFEIAGAADTYVATKNSAYGRLTLGQSEDQFLLLVDGRVDHAFPDPWERPVPVHLALTQHPTPKTVLIIGGDPSDLLSAALAHHPERVVMTYLDTGVHDLCRPYWSSETLKSLSDPRVTVVADDGRHYVSRTGERFDVVFVSARPPLTGQANRYHTREFFEAIQRVLKPNGTLTVLAPGGANLLAPEAARAAAAELATVKSVFPHVVTVPGLEMLFHAAATTGVVTANADALSKRFAARGVKTRSFSAHRFAAMYDEERIAEVNRQLSRWPALQNTDARPIVYLAAVQLWERSLTRGRAGDEIILTGIAEQWAWVWLVLPLVFWLLWQWPLWSGNRRASSRAAIFGIGTTGAAGMASEIVVLYAFQATSGQLYTGLALLIALFMAGLAIGAYLGRKKIATGKWHHSVLADGIVLAFLLLSGPVLQASVGEAALVTTWSLVAGVVTGAAFPALLGRAAAGRSQDERLAAAEIEAADHVGAAFGAMITGLIWLPVYGIIATCWLFSCFKVASIIGLVVSRKDR
ncbi:MAG: hypothetical protein QNJ97_23855 [Myxococcota bacterium]|nr:hypothetical protein [Myxococcota bacterium]